MPFESERKTITAARQVLSKEMSETQVLVVSTQASDQIQVTLYKNVAKIMLS